jgi:hypothetical protein
MQNRERIQLGTAPAVPCLTYLARRQAEGKTRKEAMRALKRPRVAGVT